MNWVLGLLRGTPVGVYALFALLLWSGARSTRSRTVGLGRLLITPAVFLIWGAATLATRSHASASLLATWFVTATAGLTLALTSSRVNVQIDIQSRSAAVMGSAAPLVRNLLIFTAKYAIGVATALHFGSRDTLALLDLGVSGASFGYFAGWAALLYRLFRRTAASTHPQIASFL